ncbi:hypothetical protein IQ241_06105 [Romeria aff. gracilis LEGE 07310]|uniref:Uncharacterized protein n=1 Tax=Vasconcelosia minhoensis LEGE 07310 TaxID=915328 RepID=A0A8J7A6J9_9CYAN|nr:hypothetical protein [Romeria gracilis]MBE9076870.1 hypothetical protein [Romeria aff. gracilis LEGE 07310]
MSENLDWLRRLASVEKRLTRVENQLDEHDQILDPSGWISEAFELQQREIEEVKGKLETIEAEVKSNGSKLDAILQRLTGTLEGP